MSSDEKTPSSGTWVQESDVEIVDIPPEEVLPLANRLELAYCSAFGSAPWFESAREARRFVLRLLDETENEEFHLVIAREAGQLAGFACGWIAIGPNKPIDERYLPLVEWLGPDTTASVLEGAFELSELAVASSRQRRGIGTRLHDKVLHNAACDRAWLLTNSTAEAAQRLYRSRGWQLVTDVGPALGGTRRVLMSRNVAS